MTKIVTIVRTKNEERNIGKFCDAYQFCDSILVADGGSTDKTIEIAKSYPKVQVREFSERVQLANGHWRNPDYKHIQFLIDWAKYEEKADWIIFDDCDMRPNFLLRKYARQLLENCLSSSRFFLVTALYVWDRLYYFPNHSKPYDRINWVPSLWAFRTDFDLFTLDRFPHFEFSYDGHHGIDLNDGPSSKVFPPFCRLHFTWETEEICNKHVGMYRDSGLIPNMDYPKGACGPIEELPEWAKE